MMKIYFAGSIRGGRQDAAIYHEIIGHLQKHGQVLTEHVGSGELTDAGEPLAHCDIHDRDFKWILESDVVVAEVTTASLGVGYEIGRAVEQGKHVLCLFRPSAEKKISAMIGGCSALVVKEYHTVEEAHRHIDDYFKGVSKKKVFTLVFAFKENSVLLGMKKRGFGAGRWNGFGGKVPHGETMEFSARRELQEEAGLGTTHLQKRGIITFIFENDPMHMEVHLFSTRGFTGEPEETEEMKPQWFAFDDIPYGSMWPDDRYWLPKFIAGKNIFAEFTFKDANTIVKHEIKEV